MEEQSRSPKDDSPNIPGDKVGHDKFDGDKVGGDKVGGDKVGGDKHSHEHNHYHFGDLKSKENIHNKILKQASPYKGLEKFDTDDKDKFFGREKDIEEIEKTLKTGNFLLILGASGSGKSSLVRAGLIPKLKDNIDDLDYLTFEPHQNPFQRLSNCLESKGEYSEAELAKKGKEDTISEVIKSLNNKNKDKTWLIFIDQFEEIFTTTKDKSKRNNFITGLVKLINENDNSVKIVLTMRSDFLDKLHHYPEIYNNNSHYMIGAMEKDKLQEAIEQPAKSHGVTFEDNLVKTIIDEFHKEEDCFLPLLGYILNLLWKKEKHNNNLNNEKRELTYKTYKELGGFNQLVNDKMNNIYRLFGKKVAKQAIKEILFELIQIKNHNEPPVSRSSYKYNILEHKNDIEQYKYEIKEGASQFCTLAVLRGTETLGMWLLWIILLQNRDALIKEKVLEELIKHRLLVVSKEKEEEKEEQVLVKLAHEKLIEYWDIIQELIKNKRSLFILRDQVIIAANQWNNYKQRNEEEKANAEILTISKIDEVAKLKEERLLKFGEDEEIVTKFINACQELHNKQQQKEKKLNEDKDKAQIDSQMRAQSDKVSKLLNTNQASDALALAIKTMGDNLKRFSEGDLSNENLAKRPGEILGVVQESLNKAMTEAIVANMCEGHEDDVYSVAFSPNGKMIVTGSSDATVRLWDTKGDPIGQPLLLKHEGSVFSVAFNSEGNMIVSGGADKTVRLWDTKGDPIGKPLRGHEDDVYSVAFSPNGKMIASGSADKTVRLWKIDDDGNFHPDKILEEHEDSVNSVAFSPDGRIIVSGSADETVRLWNIEGNTIGKPFHANKGGVESVSFSPDGKLIASGGADYKVLLWNNNQFIGEGHKASVNSIAFSPDGKILVSGSKDETICLWKIDDKGNLNLYKTLQGHKKPVNSVAFSPDGETIASGSDDCKLGLWDNKDNPIGQPLRGHTEPVFSVAFSPDGNTIASGSHDRKVCLWKIDEKGNFNLFQKLDKHTYSVNSVAFSPDEKTIASGSEDNTICLWKINDKGNFKLFQKLDKHTDSVNSVAFSPDGKIIASGSKDKTICLWKIDDKGNFNLFHKLDEHTDSVNTVAFSPDGRFIASGCEDSRVYLWDTENYSLKLRDMWCGKDTVVNSVAFSPNGQKIACGCSDYKIHLWNTEGEAIKNWHGHEDEVHSVAFSPDGQMVISGSRDKKIRLWDVEGNAFSSSPWCEHEDEVNSVAFSPDGRMIVSGSNDNKLRLWRGGWKMWLEVCCDRLLPLVLKKTKCFIHEDKNCEICARREIWSGKNFGTILIKQGNILAKRNMEEKARAKFDEAKNYDKTLKFDSEIEVKQLVAQGLLEDSSEFLQQGDIKEAIKAYEKAEKLHESIKIKIKASYWNKLCWFGSLHGFAEHPYVKNACNVAVVTETENERWQSQDSRGLNRALNDDLKGAIEDIEAFINQTEDDSKKSLREKWVRVLRSGKNPFNQEEVSRLINRGKQIC